MKDRHICVPASYLLLNKMLEDDSVGILLGLRQNTGYFDDYWALPAGHVEKDELPLDALKREAEEELGIIIQPTVNDIIHVMYRAEMDTSGERVDFFFNIDSWQGTVQNKEPRKCKQLAWFSINKLPDNLMRHNMLGITSIMQGLFFSQFHKDQLHKNPSQIL